MLGTRPTLAGARRAALLPLLAGLLVLGLPQRALAQQPGEPPDKIVLSGGALVPEGETVDYLFVASGPAVVEGTVQGTAVVLNGPLTVSGRVQGDAVVLNGPVTVQRRGVIAGDVTSPDPPQVAPGGVIQGETRGVEQQAGRTGLAGSFLGWLALAVSTLLLGLLLLAAAPRAAGQVLDAVRSRPGLAALLGVVAFIGLPLVAVLALLTLVGIPLGLALLGALALIYWIGFTAAAWLLGRTIVKGERTGFLAFLTGWAILALLTLIPVAGAIIAIIAIIMGLGAILVATHRRPPRPSPAYYVPRAGRAPGVAT